MNSDPAATRFTRAIVLCALLAVAIGIFFRCFDLDRPLFWQDEVTTALRTTGHSAVDYARIFDGKIHTMSEIRAYIELDPHKTPFDVAGVLLREDSQHTPLYYMLERLWIGLSGTSVIGMRELSVLCGVLAIALAFVLGRQLGGVRVGAISASLVALSPLFILMSRQAREYALFTDTTLLATIAFVAALRSGKTSSWVLYAAAVIVGAYSDSLFALVVAGHGFVILVTAGIRSRGFASWLIGALTAAAAFAPWVVIGYRAHERVAGEEAWVHTTYPFKLLVEKIGFIFGALSFDAEYAHLQLVIFAIVGIALTVAAVVYGLRASRGLSQIVPLAIALPTPLALAAIDVVAHSHLVTIPRYLVGTWVGLELATAVGFAIAMDRKQLRGASLGAWILLLAFGTVAAGVRGGAEGWWDDGDGLAFEALARTIDSRSQPLIVSENHWNVPLELGRYVRDDARMLLFDRKVPSLSPRQVAYIVAPSPGVLSALCDPKVYRAENASPSGPSALDAFATSAHGTSGVLSTGISAQNALWLLRPR